MEVDEGDDGEWEFDAALASAREVESLFFIQEENTEKDHWMNTIEEVLVLDETRNNEEWTNYKKVMTENKNKQEGDAYIPSTTKLPMSFMVARSIGNHTSMRLLRVLFDSGGSCTWINSRSLPRGCTPMLLDRPTSSLTLAGTLKTNHCVMMNDITLPEFDRKKRLKNKERLFSTDHAIMISFWAVIFWRRLG